MTFTLPGYRIEELVGSGGSGEVWRAVEVASGATVAVKRLGSDTALAAVRLRREAAVIGAVGGAHVVGIRDIVDDGDRCALVMDYIAGGSLASILAARGRLSPAEVVTVLSPLAGTLDAAHGKGLVHADVSPANVLFTDLGRPMLTDFGVARTLGDRAATAYGTDGYVDPAVLAGGEVTAASDVYALAAVGHVALCGEPPSPEPSREPLASLVPDAPPRLVQAIESGLVPDPLDRPDARAFATAVLLSAAAAPVRLVTPVAPATPPPTQPVSHIAEPVADPVAGLGESVDRGSRRGARTRLMPDRVPVWRRGARPLAVVVVAAVLLAGAVAVGHRLSLRGTTEAAGLATEPTAPTVTSGPPGRSTSSTTTGVTESGPARRHSHEAGAGRGSRRTRIDSSDGRPPVVAPPPVPSSATPATSPAAPPPSAAPVDWRAVVAHLETQRAAAFVNAEPAVLDAVYRPGAPALAADRATVTSIADRGLRAVGFVATVRHVALLRRTADTARVRVVDRLSGYRLVDATGDIEGRGPPRPDRAIVMTLVSNAGRWQVATVSAG